MTAVTRCLQSKASPGMWMWSSTTLTTPGCYVATSKTDQLGQGVDVVLGRTAVNNSHNPKMVCCHVQDRPAGTRGGCCSWQDGRQQPSQSPDGMLPHPAGTRGGCCLLCWAGQPSSECGVWCLQMEFQGRCHIQLSMTISIGMEQTRR